MPLHRNPAKDIAEFQKRMETERSFCEYLFYYSTVRVMAHKYLYYERSMHIVEDITYDGEEYGWHIMGRALGHLKEEDTSPCVGFDHNHPRAKRAEALAKVWIRKGLPK